MRRIDEAADPVLVWNRQAEEWWMIYTNRRANVEGPHFAWVHGTDLGVASSSDGGASWVYRGTLTGLDFEGLGRSLSRRENNFTFIATYGQ